MSAFHPSRLGREKLQKSKLYTPDNINRNLRTAEQLLNQCHTLADFCRSLKESAPNFHRWHRLYCWMKATEAKRLKELDQENARLTRLLADAELDTAMLKALVKANSLPGATPQRRIPSAGSISVVSVTSLPSGGPEPHTQHGVSDRGAENAQANSGPCPVPRALGRRLQCRRPRWMARASITSGCNASSRRRGCGSVPTRLRKRSRPSGGKWELFGPSIPTTFGHSFSIRSDHGLASPQIPDDVTPFMVQEQ